MSVTWNHRTTYMPNISTNHATCITYTNQLVDKNKIEEKEDENYSKNYNIGRPAKGPP